jgi:hypothetical protein
MRYWGAFPGESLCDLLGDPLDPNQLASVMRDDRQTLEQPQADGRHDEHIDGTDVRSMIAQEGLPALRRWPTAAYHVLGDGRLGDFEAELEQFAWIRGAPQSGFALLISAMSARNSWETLGLPTRWRERQCQ